MLPTSRSHFVPECAHLQPKCESDACIQFPACSTPASVLREATGSRTRLGVPTAPNLELQAQQSGLALQRVVLCNVSALEQCPNKADCSRTFPGTQLHLAAVIFLALFRLQFFLVLLSELGNDLSLLCFACAGDPLVGQQRLEFLKVPGIVLVIRRGRCLYIMSARLTFISCQVFVGKHVFLTMVHRLGHDPLHADRCSKVANSSKQV